MIGKIDAIGKEPTNKFSSSSKIVVNIQTKATPFTKVSKEPSQEDEIDEFIKKYADDENNAFKQSNSSDSSYSSSSASSATQFTPKQTLLNGLARLSDPKLKKYSLSERETFIFDLESILKVLTYKETVTYVFPCLDAYAAEQEYLQTELFKQLPNVFKKLLRSPARPSDSDALDLLTVNLFPLISQVLMTAEDSV